MLVGCQLQELSFQAYLMLALEAGYNVESESVGSGLGVETGEKRGGGDHAHVGVVEALVGAERVKAADGCTIDQTGRDVVELSGCQYVSLEPDRSIILTLTRWSTPWFW
jgi:hypothetical protein